jgi:hypothetical protein
MQMRAAIAAAAVLAAAAASLAAPSPPSAAPVFARSDVLSGVRIAAPFSDLYGRPRDKKYKTSVKGTLDYVDAASSAVARLGSIEIEMRGGTSRQLDQCLFAKLTLKLPKEDRGAAALFGTSKKIKIGTHCGESETPSPKFARVRNEREPIREALIYTILNRVGTVTLKARPTLITYLDTSKKVDPRLFPENPLTRHAFFIEHEDEAAKRYGAKIIAKGGGEEVDDPRSVDPGRADPLSVALSIFAEALTENYDWHTDDDSLWNVNALKTRNGKVLFQVYDWDVSGWVRGPAPGDIFRVVNKALADVDSMTPLVLHEATQAYVDARAQIYADLDATFPEDSSADPAGRQNIKKHLDDFYAWLCRPVTEGSARVC